MLRQLQAATVAAPSAPPAALLLCAALSADGGHAAAGMSDGALCVWRVMDEGAAALELVVAATTGDTAPTSEVTALAWRGASRGTLVVASEGTCAVWRLGASGSDAFSQQAAKAEGCTEGYGMACSGDPTGEVYLAAAEGIVHCFRNA